MTDLSEKTTKELVKYGVDQFAIAEVALRNAQDAMNNVAKVFPAAYVNGDIAGFDAVEMDAACGAVAGLISKARLRTIDAHRKASSFAQSADADIPTPLAELPQRKGPQSRSGGRT